MDDPKVKTINRKSYKHISTVLLFLVAAAVIAFGFYRFFDYYDVRDTLLKNRAIDIAKAGAVFISADEIANAVQTGDTTDLRDSLMRMNEQWNGEYSAYIYTQNGDRLTTLSGVDTKNELDLTDEQYWQPIKTGELYLMKPLPDSGGTWGGVLVPISQTDSGQIYGVLGIRYFKPSWSDLLTSKAFDSGAVVLFSLLLLLVVYRLHRKNRQIAGVSNTLKQREAVFNNLIDLLPLGVAIGQSGELESVRVNKKYGDIFGITQENLKKMSIDELMKIELLPAGGQETKPGAPGIIGNISETKQISKPNGQTAWVNMYTVSMNQGENVEQNHLCIIDDVTERILIETALRESERSKAVILAHLPGMAYRCLFDHQWSMLFVSEGCENLTGYNPRSLLYNKDISFSELIMPEYREGLWHEWERVLALNIPFQGEYEIVTKNGDRKWVMEMGQGVYDTEGNVVALEGLIIDMTSKKISEAQIKHMSDHDFLTGLYNRKYFEEAKSKAKQSGIAVSIIMANINGVRLINDAFGHAEGDRVIIDSASIMKRRCREGDILARTGGDEFSMLLHDTDAATTKEILQNINKACEQYNNINPNRRYDISLTLGCGTAVMGESVEKAAKEAEESMHNNKLLNRKSSHSTILSSVMATMFERSQETEEHAERLGQLSKSIGEMLGLPQKSLVELELFSMLHDIGKVGIDDRILNKPDKLTDEEWVVMKKHPEIGYRIAMSSPELEPIAEYILTHHERWDGKGYPRGLKGEEIPLLARILAVADAYDAMTEDRIYRKALTKHAALEEIEKNAGTQFDPLIANKFVESMK